MGFGDRDYYGGSRQDQMGYGMFPQVIKMLLIINGAVFIFQYLMQNLSFGGVPGSYYVSRWFALNPLDPRANFQIWQLVTYQFMHADFFHIFFNMLILWMLGREVEYLWGSSKFLFFYLSAGIVGGVLNLIFTPALTIGASGSVYGVMVAFAMYYPDRYIYINFLLPVKAKYLVVFLVVFEFLSLGSMDVIAHTVHIGGAFSGFFFVLLDRKYNINVDAWIGKIKRTRLFEQKGENSFKGSFRKPFRSDSGDVKDAKFYDIDGEKRGQDTVPQEEIDRILDKISQSGYQNLTDEEKRILFEASKKN